MSRTRHLRLRVSGLLTATQPLHVGGLPNSDETDLPVAVDGQGRIYIPGTSLAGAMRGWMESRFDSQLVEAMWGMQDAKGSAGGAGAITVDDGIIQDPAAAPEIWDGVGIDREWGTAASRVKFDRAVLPVGSTFSFTLTLDLPASRFPGNTTRVEEQDSRVQAALGHLLDALRNGSVALGAAKTRGLGRIELDKNVVIQCEDWQSRTGIVEALFGAQTPSSTTIDDLKSKDPIVPHQPASLRIEIEWTPESPTMVQASGAGVNVDALPMITRTKDGRMTLVIPGSSVKGALRTQAERIVRTVLPHRAQAAADWPPEGRGRHLAQTAEPLVDELFGAPLRKTTPAGLTGTQGLLSCDTCMAETGHALPSDWNAIAVASADPAIEGGAVVRGSGLSGIGTALEEAGLLTDAATGPRFDHAYHVAVDRWTGGAAEHLLFSELQPTGITWEPLRLHVDLEALQQKGLAGPAVALVLLLVRDLWEHRIPIGTKTNRGFGSIAVTRVRFTIDGTAPGLEGLHECDVEKTLNGVPDATLQHLQERWGAWIDREISEAPK